MKGIINKIKVKINVLGSKVRQSYHFMSENASERLNLSKFKEDGSIGGQIAGIIILFVEVVIVLGIFAHFGITISKIEQWFRDFGLGVWI